MYGIRDAFVAYCFDGAVTRWGNAFEAAVSACTRGTKTEDAADKAVQRTVRRWLKLPAGPPPGVGQTIRG